MDDELMLRIGRLESEAEIRQLVARYALLVDSRDLEGLGDLFTETASFGEYGIGPNGARARFRKILTGFYRSIHLIGGHVIKFENTGSAVGVLHARAEHEVQPCGIVRETTAQSLIGEVDQGHQAAQRDQRRKLCPLLG